MPYKINGTTIPTQPTTGRWIPREVLGVNGSGNPIYPGVRDFELKWQLIDPETAYNIQEWFELVGTTGSVVVDLPYFLSGSNYFMSYTGCVLREPTIGTYFSGYLQDMVLIVSKVVT